MDRLVESLHLAHPPAALPAKDQSNCRIRVDGYTVDAIQGERLIDALNRSGKDVPQVCYHPQMGPIQTCDTCMVEVDGELVRACGEKAAAGLTVVTGARSAGVAEGRLRPYSGQSPALLHGVRQQQRQLRRCTTPRRCSKVEHQTHPYKPKPYRMRFYESVLPL